MHKRDVDRLMSHLEYAAQVGSINGATTANALLLILERLDRLEGNIPGDCPQNLIDQTRVHRVDQSNKRAGARGRRERP